MLQSSDSRHEASRKSEVWSPWDGVDNVADDAEREAEDEYSANMSRLVGVPTGCISISFKGIQIWILPTSGCV